MSIRTDEFFVGNDDEELVASLNSYVVENRKNSILCPLCGKKADGDEDFIDRVHSEDDVIVSLWCTCGFQFVGKTAGKDWRKDCEWLSGMARTAYEGVNNEIQK